MRPTVPRNPQAPPYDGAMVEIRLVRTADILEAPNAGELLQEYALECLVPIHPQAEQYAQMEDLGALLSIGVYDLGADQDPNQDLIGFASLLMALMPHNGLKVATVESMFVCARKRPQVGMRLLYAIEDYAREAECTKLLYSVRVGSDAEWIMMHRKECRRTHTVFTRDLG